MFYANDTPEAYAFEMVDQERKAVEREMCDGGRKEFRATVGKMLRSSIDPNVQVQVQANMTNPMAQDRSQDTPMQLLVDNKQGSQGVIPVTTTEQGCRFFVPMMAFISLLSFVMSATSIALFVAIMNSDINDSVKASSKPSKSLGGRWLLLILILQCLALKSECYNETNSSPVHIGGTSNSELNEQRKLCCRQIYA